MHRVSDIFTSRPNRSESLVMVKLRSPELAKALHGSGVIVAVSAWCIFSAALGWFAWEGGLGRTAHATVIYCIASGVAYWIAINGNRLWQGRNRTTLYRLNVRLTERLIEIDGPECGFTLRRDGSEFRFSSRPHRRGKHEERDERRVEHPIGYEYRDAWEVWCETGHDVRFIVAVSEEVDARAIVRQLTEENMSVTRGLEDEDFGHERVEPA